MTSLRAPTHNRTPREVRQIAVRDHVTYLALAFDTTRTACRWFSVAELNTANHPADVLAATKTAPKRYRVSEPKHVPFMTEHEFTCAEPPRAIVLWQPTLILTPALAANVNASAGVVIKVVPPVTLFHEAMKAA